MQSAFPARPRRSEKRAKTRHMATDLHDGDGLDRANGSFQRLIVKGAGKHGQPVASRHKGPNLGGGTGRQAC